MRKLMVSGGERTVPTAALSQASLEGQKRDITPSELSEVVLLRLRETDLADQSMPRVAETVTRFTAYLERGQRYDQKLWNPELEGERGVPSHLT